MNYDIGGRRCVAICTCSVLAYRSSDGTYTIGSGPFPDGFVSLSRCVLADQLGKPMAVRNEPNHSQLTTSAYNQTIVHGCLLNDSKRLLSMNNLFLTTIS